MQSIRTLCAAIMATVGMAMLSLTAAPPEIRNVKAFQQYPWGKVCISYEVVGDVFREGGLACIVMQDKTSGVVVCSDPNYLSGDVSATIGLHNVIWDIAGQGVAINSDGVVFTVFLCAKFMVVDLSEGANASSYPVAFMAEPPPGGFNKDEYKTTKLVLSFIPPGRFMMRGQYDVTLKKPYYIGIFEVTKTQYSLVMGSNPPGYSSRTLPVDRVSYNEIRGSTNGVKWPSSSAVDSSSFIGKLRARTGLDFDLPTDAQWEYACRAGTTTTYSYGDSPRGGYMWYEDNADSQAHYVGTKLPNTWGLYDMHGNVYEWCLDWYGSLTSGVTDPKGPSSGSNRVLRGGSWFSGASACGSSCRSYTSPSSYSDKYGFRLARTLSE